MKRNADELEKVVRLLKKQPPERREQSLKAIESVDEPNNRLLRNRLKDESDKDAKEPKS